MKKLLLMVPMLHQGGFERVCVKTARVLQDRCDVTILIFSDRDINYDIEGLHVVNIDVPSVKGTAGKVKNVLRRVQKTKKIKKENHYDIAYSFGPTASIVNVLSGEGEKVLTGLRCQTDMENPRLVRLFCKKSDEVLSCSREIMRQLERDYGYTKSSYIYNPLDVPDIRKKAEEEISDFPFKGEGLKIIVSMGREDHIKGFWHLLKAFSLVIKDHPEARLLILGAGSFERYKKLAEDLGIADLAAFPGVRKNPFPYAGRSDLYVLPSNREGFPNALLEAMALSLPVIAADCKTGPREIVLSDSQYEALIKEKPDGSSIEKPMDGEYGVLIPDMDPSEDFDAGNITEDDRMLAGEISRMLEDSERREHFGRAAGDHAKIYAPEKYRDAIDGIFRKVLKESS